MIERAKKPKPEPDDDKPATHYIDIFGEELKHKSPHWLSPAQTMDPERKREIREKHRARAQAEAKKKTLPDRWRKMRAEAEQTLARLKGGTWQEEDHPRDPDGKFTESGGGGGGGTTKPSGGSKPATEPKPADKPAAASSSKAKGKKEFQPSDFAKDEVHIVGSSAQTPEKQKEFIDKWNEKIGEAPAEFKNQFLGGLPGTMQVRYVDYEDRIAVSGNLVDESGNTIGTYNREFDFNDNMGVSAYFKLKDAAQGKGIGKTMLAANVAMYQQLGFDKVETHANIDVGGKAWAKYGYVPTKESWSELQDTLNNKIDELSGEVSSGSYTAESWEELDEHQQGKIEQAWMRSTRDDFLNSEIENWRDSGGGLSQAKYELAAEFDASFTSPESQWAYDGLKEMDITVGDDSVSLAKFLIDKGSSLDVVLDNTTVTFDDRRGDGEGDPEITIDDTKTPELTDDQRMEIEAELVKLFNSRAESNAPDVDPPSHIADGVDDSQEEYWKYSVDDDYRFQWAKDNAEDYLTREDDDGGSGGGTGEMDLDEAEVLRALANNPNPKALWQIADSDWGEQLLLGTDWSGVIDFNDKQSMDRFNAYVGKRKA